MSTPSELFRRLRIQATAASLFLAAAVLAGQPAALAAPAPQEAGGAVAAAPASQTELRQLIERRYEVLPIRDGLLLKPRKERLGVRAIELRGTSIAVNGEPVNERVLRSWLGEEEADPILRLARLARSAQRALFGLDGAEALPSTTPTTPGPPGPPGSPAPPAAPLPVPVPGPGSDEAEVPDLPEAPEPPEMAEAPEAPDTAEAAEAAEDDRSGRRGGPIKVAGSVTVDAGEVAEEVVVFGGPVRIDGEVIGDVSSFGGPVRVNGKVGGSINAIGNSVHLGPKSVVLGDVSSILGKVHRAPGARVEGSISEATKGGVKTEDQEIDWSWGHGYSPWGRVSHFVGSLFRVMLLALLACLVLLLARGPLERVENKIAADPWASLGAGVGVAFLSALLIAPVTVLLIVTIVGCLVVMLYPVLALVLVLFLLLGYTAVALRIGRWMEGRFGWRLGNPYLHVLLGVAVIHVFFLLGRLFGIAQGVLDWVSGMFLFVGVVVEVAAWMTGFGALVLTRFGLGPRWRRPFGDPGLPPVPPAPPEPSPLLGEPLPPTAATAATVPPLDETPPARQIPPAPPID
jgi:cytoskeletal protein CcmA (bactofilin family)